jgi:hypothetical protein
MSAQESKEKKQKKRPRELNVLAASIVGEATEADEPITLDAEESPKNPNAVALGRLGGLKGGKARAEKLTPEERSEIAKRAAKARWKKDK